MEKLVSGDGAGGSSRLPCGVPAGRGAFLEWKSRVEEFLAQPEIKVTKQTKRSEKSIFDRISIKWRSKEGLLLYAGICKFNYTK